MEDRLSIPHYEILQRLKDSGISGKIEYRQNCHMSFYQDMTVGRYLWHDDTGTKRFLFVLEEFGNPETRSTYEPYPAHLPTYH